MPPVALGIFFPFDDDTLPIVFVTECAQYTIMTGGIGDQCLVVANTGRWLTHSSCRTHPPLTAVATPACANIGWEWVGWGIWTLRLESHVCAVLARTDTNSDIGSGVWSIARLVGAAFGSAG